MLLGLLVITMYFIHGQGLVLTRINQTEQITVECKAGPPTVPVPSSENSKLPLPEMIISVLCVCAVLGFLKLMTTIES
jgi:hypothetical protein